MMFKIGDTVYMAKYDRIEKHIECPDCFGQRYLTVTLGNSEQVQIPCQGCNHGGWEGVPMGYITTYEYGIEVKKHTVTGMEIRQGMPIEYKLDWHNGVCWIGKEREVFATKEEAIAYGESQKAKHEAEAKKQALTKTHDHRSWAWHVTYHRRELKNHLKQAEYHQSMLDVAKAKEKK